MDRVQTAGAGVVLRRGAGDASHVEPRRGTANGECSIAPRPVHPNYSEVAVLEGQAPRASITCDGHGAVGHDAVVAPRDGEARVALATMRAGQEDYLLPVRCLECLDAGKLLDKRRRVTVGELATPASSG